MLNFFLNFISQIQHWPYQNLIISNLHMLFYSPWVIRKRNEELALVIFLLISVCGFISVDRYLSSRNNRWFRFFKISRGWFRFSSNFSFKKKLSSSFLYGGSDLNFNTVSNWTSFVTFGFRQSLIRIPIWKEPQNLEIELVLSPSSIIDDSSTNMHICDFTSEIAHSWFHKWFFQLTHEKKMILQPINKSQFRNQK
jgi:hypothetical protein